MILRVLAIAAALLTFMVGAAPAQIVPSQDGAREANPSPSPKRSINSSTASCYSVFVEVVDPHPTGLNWDLGSGRTSAPDPVITEASTGAQTTCRDTHTCSLQIDNAGGMLSFTIMDADFPSADDLIGEGQCGTGKTCRIGRARVSMKSC